LELWTRTFIDADGSAPVGIEEPTLTTPRSSSASRATASAGAPPSAATESPDDSPIREGTRFGKVVRAVASRAALLAIYTTSLIVYYLAAPIGRMVGLARKTHTTTARQRT